MLPRRSEDEIAGQQILHAKHRDREIGDAVAIGIGQRRHPVRGLDAKRNSPA